MKQLFTLFLVLSLSSFSQIPTAGLIGGWPFTGNAQDMSGSGNHGTVTGATLTTDRFSVPNCAYNFNGTSNYITMLAAGPTGSVSRSVSFWERSTNTVTTGGNPPVGFGYGQPGSGGSFQINFNYGCQAVGIDNSSSAVMHGSSILNNGQWHHIVVVFDSSLGNSTGSVLIYIDGALQSAISCAVSSTNSPFVTNSLMPVRIGRDNSIRYFNGDLDDFYMYNRAVTPAEVLQLYNYSPCTAAPGDPSGIAGSNSICSGASAIYSVAPVSGATSYSWSLPGGWTGTSSTNTISIVAGANSGIISVIAGNPCGNSQAVTLNVTVNPSPTISVASTHSVICKGNSTDLNAMGASTYTWNSFIITQSITVSPTVTTSYSVSGSNSFGCLNSTVFTVTVTNNPLPTIAVNGPTIMCTGQTVNLASNGASTYTWLPGNLNGFFVSVSPTVTTTYTVTGTDANGCYNSVTYTQSVSSCTGLNAIAQSKTVLSIYPNPFNYNIILKANPNTISVVEIYNSLGKLVYKNNFENTTEIDLKDKESGIYFVRILNEYGAATEKIIKY
jgi:hypothetical protein